MTCFQGTASRVPQVNTEVLGDVSFLQTPASLLLWPSVRGVLQCLGVGAHSPQLKVENLIFNDSSLLMGQIHTTAVARRNLISQSHLLLLKDTLVSTPPNQPSSSTLFYLWTSCSSNTQVKCCSFLQFLPGILFLQTAPKVTPYPRLSNSPPCLFQGSVPMSLFGDVFQKYSLHWLSICILLLSLHATAMK
jgi:hypothetical protein